MRVTKRKTLPKCKYISAFTGLPMLICMRALQDIVAHLLQKTLNCLSFDRGETCLAISTCNSPIVHASGRQILYRLGERVTHCRETDINRRTSIVGAETNSKSVCVCECECKSPVCI